MVWWERENLMVYIEMKSYRTDRGVPDLEFCEDILKLGRLLCDGNSPKRLLSMTAAFPAEDIEIRQPRLLLFELSGPSLS
jgi:hypothetical protein